MIEKQLFFHALMLHDTPTAILEREQRRWRSVSCAREPFNILPPFMPVQTAALAGKSRISGVLIVGAPQLLEGYLLCPLSLSTGGVITPLESSFLPEQWPLFPGLPPLPRTTALILGHTGKARPPSAAVELTAFSARVACLVPIELNIRTDGSSFYRCDRSLGTKHWIKFTEK